VRKRHLRILFSLVLAFFLIQGGTAQSGDKTSKGTKKETKSTKPSKDTSTSPSAGGREFFPTTYQYKSGEAYYDELKRRVDSLQDALDVIRVRLSEYDRLSLPQIRKEIKHMLNLPEKVSRIILKNGTIVEGKIRNETLDVLTVQTPIGILRIEKQNVKRVIPYENLHAKVVLKGDFEDQYYLTKRVFRGRLKNTGQRRADFVRIIFKLHDKSTQVVAKDSAFVNGKEVTFFSGVVSTSSLDPGAEGEFEVTVHLPPGVKMNTISYVTYKVHYEEFE